MYEYGKNCCALSENRQIYLTLFNCMSMVIEYYLTLTCYRFYANVVVFYFYG